MADLDDFFAKKDRKKSQKAKAKFATPEELAKSIEEAAKKAAESKARKVTPAVEGGATAAEVKKAEKAADEEWKEFEEERKDYSGLKLTQLTISEQEGGEDAGGKDGGAAGDGEGEGGEAGSGNSRSGAWRNVESGGAADSAAEKQQQQQQQRPSSSVYVTPAMKNMRLKKKGVAPDLKNEEFFPTLGAEQPADPSALGRGKKDSTFEEVKHGGRVRASDLPSAQPLQVGNRFTSLSNDAS